jgi:hypothetical protein
MQLDRKIYGLWKGLTGKLCIYPEHGEDGFLQKVNTYQPHYKALHPEDRPDFNHYEAIKSQMKVNF